MRGRASWIAAVMGIVAASPLRVHAQDLSTPRCVAGPPGSATLIAQDACQQAYDVYQLIAPQLGLALAGGNATAGTGSVLGGLGHFSVGVRVNVFDGLFPNTSNGGYPVSTSGAQRRTLPTQGQWFGAPTADAAIGLYKGFPLALTNVLGVDALISAEYVPTIHEGDFSLDPSSNFQFGFGARIGLLSESIAFPGLSFTWIERDLPTINVGVNASADVGVSGSTIDINNMDVKTRAWRIVASKSLMAFFRRRGRRARQLRAVGDAHRHGQPVRRLDEPVVGRDTDRWAARISSATSRSICPCSRSCSRPATRWVDPSRRSTRSPADAPTARRSTDRSAFA